MAEGIRIGVRDSTRTDSEKDTRRVSYWKVLINTNVTPRSKAEQEGIVKNLGGAFYAVFGKTGQPSKLRKDYLMWGDDSKPPVYTKNENDPSGLPIKTETKAGIELGKKYGKVHLHGSFKVVHHGNLRLDYDELADLLRDLICRVGEDCFRVTKPYISFKHYPVEDGDVDYIAKGNVVAEYVIPELNVDNIVRRERTPRPPRQ
jgi:hypothetical protein